MTIHKTGTRGEQGRGHPLDGRSSGKDFSTKKSFFFFSHAINSLDLIV
jgi:hypothetical protein